MFCEKCGTEIPKGAKFCEKCGSQVEPDTQKAKEKNSYIYWILGGAITGIVIVAVIVMVLFATGKLGGNKENIQTSTNSMQSDTDVSETVTQSEEPAASAIVSNSTPTPVSAESPVENAGGDEPEEPAEEEVPDDNDEEEENTEYIFPNSDSEYLTKSDVKNMSASKINLAKNELYARHGRIFDREDLQEYFAGCSWYNPLYTAEEWDEFGDSYFFNEYEIENRDLLIKWENKKK